MAICLAGSNTCSWLCYWYVCLTDSKQWPTYHLLSICFNVAHKTATDPTSSRDAMQLAPMPDSYDLDRGLLLSVQAIQVHTMGLIIFNIFIEFWEHLLILFTNRNLVLLLVSFAGFAGKQGSSSYSRNWYNEQQSSLSSPSPQNILKLILTEVTVIFNYSELLH